MISPVKKISRIFLAKGPYDENQSKFFFTGDMVLGWLNGDNSVIKGILDKIATLENRIKLLESENAAQKEEIAAMRNGNSNTSTEWRDMLIGKKKKLAENQRAILNAVEDERIDRENREESVILFGVPESKAASEEESKKEDEATILAIFEVIGYDRKWINEVKRFKANPNRK